MSLGAKKKSISPIKRSNTRSADRDIYSLRNKGVRSENSYSDITPYKGFTKNSPKRLLLDFTMGRTCFSCSNIEPGDQWIECTKCKKWFHGIKCQNLKKKIFDSIVAVKGIPWHCSFCLNPSDGAVGGIGDDSSTKTNIDMDKLLASIDQKLDKQSTRLETKMSDLEASMTSEIRDLKLTTANLQNQISDMGATVNKCVDKIGSLESNFSFKTSADFNTAVESIVIKVNKDKDLEDRAEHEQREIRRNRIVISNVPTGSPKTEDTNFVVQLGSFLSIAIQPDDIRYSYRAPRNSDPTDPLLIVCFKDLIHKYNFLDQKVTTKLKEIPVGALYHGYRINPDRTFKERDVYKKLRAEASRENGNLPPDSNEVFVVRNYKVTKITKKSDPLLSPTDPQSQSPDAV